MVALNAAAALRWLQEMHRLIRPGGHLIITNHGLQSCVWLSRPRNLGLEARLGTQWIANTAERLQSDGHCFWNFFGPDGDEGVVADDWGLAFFTPEWLLEHVNPGMVRHDVPDRAGRWESGRLRAPALLGAEA